LIKRLLYTGAVHFMKLGLALGGSFNAKLALRKQGANNWKIFATKRDQAKPLIWFHCASLGEFEQGRPVMERFRKEYPHWQILLTFFSPSGYEIRKNYTGADIICYLPFDLPKDVKLFLDLYQPNLAVFVKYEFWKNTVEEIKARNIPLISISTILRPDQYFFKFWGNLGRQTLKKFDHFFVQNQQTADLLETIGIHSYTIAGDTRFDRVADSLKAAFDISEIVTFKGENRLMVCGSVWQQDMEVLIPMIRKTTGLKFIIAPHEIDREEIDKWEAEIGLKCIRFSEKQSISDWSSYDILFIDSIGLLSSLYRYGDFAFIGGAFGKGLHNILEAATFGMPVFFGKKTYHKFQEAVDLIEESVAFPVCDSEELEEKIKRFCRNESLLAETSLSATEYVKNHTGATDVVLGWIKNRLASC
jgi:3-deoxy-D-manno-octulosonic-acid transferase